MVNNLFVYGTLKRGHRLNGILDGQKYKGEYHISPPLPIWERAGYVPVQIKLMPGDIESTIYIYTDETDMNLSDNYIIIEDNIKEWKYGRTW